MTLQPKLPRTLRLNARDNVVVAVDVIDQGSATPEGVAALQRVPKGHKMAVAPIEKDQPIDKFGQIIGFASESIVPGTWVHTQNCVFHAFERDYAFAADARNEAVLPLEQQATFEGFRRPDGKARRPEARKLTTRRAPAGRYAACPAGRPGQALRTDQAAPGARAR